MPNGLEGRVRAKIRELREAAADFRRIGDVANAGVMDARANNFFIGFQNDLEIISEFFPEYCYQRLHTNPR